MDLLGESDIRRLICQDLVLLDWDLKCILTDFCLGENDVDVCNCSYVIMRRQIKSAAMNYIVARYMLCMLYQLPTVL